jgi:hypothetical protein
MKEQDLINLGFEKIKIVPEENDGLPCYYYEYNFEGLSLCLITEASDEVVDDYWTAVEFNSENLVFTDVDDLTLFIQVVEKNVKP